MHSTYCWYESYRAAVLETDGSKMKARIHAAEFEIRERQRALFTADSETSAEGQALYDALNNLRVLQRDTTSWSAASPMAASPR